MVRGVFKARSLSKEEGEEKLPFGGVLLPLDANLAWPPDKTYVVENIEEQKEVEELEGKRPSLRFACSFALSFLDSWHVIITSKTNNPFNWPAIVFLPTDQERDFLEWLDDYNRYAGYYDMINLDPFEAFDYEDYIQNNLLPSLGAIVSLQQSAMRYLQYYGVPVENIVSKYLELAKSVPSDGYATEAPPAGVYVWSYMSKGRPMLLGYDLSKPMNITEFFATIEALKERYDVEDVRELPEELVEKLEGIFVEVLIVLPASNDLQSLLRLGDLYIRPSEIQVGIAKADVSINPKAKKILDSNKAEPYELAIAILALLDKPLTTVYKSIPRELPKEAKQQERKALRRTRTYGNLKSRKDAS